MKAAIFGPTFWPGVRKGLHTVLTVQVIPYTIATNINTGFSRVFWPDECSDRKLSFRLEGGFAKALMQIIVLRMHGGERRESECH